MPKFENIELVKHIQIEIDYIINVINKTDESTFYENEDFKRSLTRSFEII